MIIEELIVTLGLDPTAFNNGLSSAQNSVSSAMSNLSSIGSAVTAVFAGATVAVGAFAINAIGKASDLNETISKTTVIFGDSSDKILNWSKNAANAMGTSQKSALDAAGGFAMFGSSAGLAGKDLDEFAMSNVGLATDLASFYNTTTEEAQTAIQAAFRGETEPIRKYNVMLDDASMRITAVKMGLISTTKTALTPQQKVLVANKLIWEQTNKAQGDFAKTSDGLANQQRILTANIENITTTLGTALLPAVNAVAGVFIEWINSPEVQTGIGVLTTNIGLFADYVIANIPVVIQGFQNFVTFLQNNEGIIVGVLTALTVAVGAFVWSVVAPMLPVIATFALVAGAAYLLYEAWTSNFGGIQDKTKAVWSFIQPILSNLWTWLSKNIPLALQTLSNFWTGTLLPAIMTVWSWINTNLMPLFVALGQVIQQSVLLYFTNLVAFWRDTMIPILKTLYEWFSNKVLPILTSVANFVGGRLMVSFNRMTDFIGGVTSKVQELVKWLQKLNGVHVNVPVSGGSGGIGAGASAPNKGKASGGVINAGESVWVGESGKEVFTAGKGGGYVTPNHKTTEKYAQQQKLEIDYQLLARVIGAELAKVVS